jgi:uncharacterized protein YgiM (DUF1202 family)
MRNKILIPILLVVLALVLQGCLPQAPQPQTIDQEAVDRAVQQTLQALSLFQTATAVAQPVVMESPTALPTFTAVLPTETAVPAPTLTTEPSPTAVPTETQVLPTLTPVPTLTPSVPMVSVSVNTNCRSGPSRFYDLLGGLRVGETARVVGTSPSTNYWIIETPRGTGVCWLWNGYATVTGNTAALPVIETPPPPPAPRLGVRSDTACYAGPSSDFDQLGTLKAGQNAELFGRDRYSQYWQIKNPSASGNCWISDKDASFSGTMEMVEYVKAPILATKTQGYACQVTPKVEDGKIVAPLTDFDARWTIKNTGSKTWTTSQVDYLFRAGVEMQKFHKIYDLPKELAPGESMDLIVDMVAPEKTGFYGTTWVVKLGSDTLCTLPLAIEVRK